MGGGGRGEGIREIAKRKKNVFLIMASLTPATETSVRLVCVKARFNAGELEDEDD